MISEKLLVGDLVIDLHPQLNKPFYEIVRINYKKGVAYVRRSYDPIRGHYKHNAISVPIERLKFIQHRVK